MNMIDGIVLDLHLSEHIYLLLDVTVHLSRLDRLFQLL
jgi:hypothetical protein